MAKIKFIRPIAGYKADEVVDLKDQKLIRSFTQNNFAVEVVEVKKGEDDEDCGCGGKSGEKEALTQENETLKADLATSNGKVAELEGKLAQEVEAKTAAETSLQESIDSSKAKETELTQVKSELEDLKKENEALKADLKKAKSSSNQNKSGSNPK